MCGEVLLMCAFHNPPLTARMRVSNRGSVDGPETGCADAQPDDAARTQSRRARAANFITMDFDYLDRYLLDGAPPKAQVVKDLLKKRADVPGAAAFYQGIQMLGPKTPDLTLIALRLILAGKPADDVHVVRLRNLVDRARAKGIDAQSSIDAYYKELE